MKKLLFLFLSFMMSFTAFTAPSAGAATVKVDYVALGDSIAAGQTPYGSKTGTSYTDMIAAKLESQGVLSTFTKKFALSGETSTEFLAKLKVAEVQSAIKTAELVTISTGANDLLQFARSGSKDEAKAFELLTTIDQNLSAGIQTIKSLNPKADIYVFGYYFPFPAMADGTQKAYLQEAFNYFNIQLKATASSRGAKFVEVASKFSADYLPNAADVHPNEAGYKVFADQFFTVWKAAPSADPFTDIGTSGSQARLAIIKLSEAGIISGKADGTFAPKSNITRAETAIIMARALRKTNTPKNPGFSDVSPRMKSYTAIAQLKEAGIFATAPKFNPDKPLTRAQMARVLTQALDIHASTNANFTDVPPNHWAKIEIDAVYSSKIMTGGTNSMFYPEKNITREQFAMTVYNVMYGAGR